MQLLREQPQLSAPAIAAALGIGKDGVKYHLNQLKQTGITPGPVHLVATPVSFKPNATDFQGQLVAPGLSAKGFHQP